MPKTIAIANQKGGVAKTTTSINLAASLAATRRKVLVVDMDPQGNTTMGSGVDKNSLGSSVYDVLMGEKDIAEVMIFSEAAGYDLLPANADLTAAEVHLMTRPEREYSLKKAIAKIKAHYDYIFLDCPPSLNMLTVNGLVACDTVMIPMQCEYYALEGLAALINTIEDIKSSLNPELEIEGILRTMFDPRNSLTKDVSAQLHEHFPEKVYRSVIPRNIRLAEAPSYGMPAMYYDKSSNGAKAYLALAGEMIRKEDKTTTGGAGTVACGGN